MPTTAMNFLLDADEKTRTILKREGGIAIGSEVEAANGREQRHPCFTTQEHEGKQFVVRIFKAARRLPRGTLGFADEKWFATMEEALAFANEINPEA